MTIEKAINELFETDKFKEAARRDAKLAVYRNRHRHGKLGKSAAIVLLEKYGYEVVVKK